jgi:glycosyltransferase involved in cell wall biosynthesis
MRILLVHNRYRCRGGEDIVFETERHLLEGAGHEIVVYERHNDEITDYPLWRQADLPRRTIWATDSVRAIRKILIEHRPEVAHFYNTFPLISPAPYYACASEEVPVVQTLPNYRLSCPGAQFLRDGRVCELCLGKVLPWKAVRYGCYRNSRAQTTVVAAMLLFHRIAGTWKRRVQTYIALTDFSRRKYIECGLPAEKIVVKPNFLRPDPGPRIRDSGYAVFVGRLSPEKGISSLLKAWGDLPGVPLKIVGDGPMISTVRQFAASTVGTEVEPLGWRSRDAVINILKEASFLVIPSSWYEGFPLTIVEAFACGVPVIGSRLGGIGEIVRHEESGLLVDPENAEALAESVRRLWNDIPFRLRLGRGARAQFEACYTAERNYEMLMEIFQNAATRT